MPAKQLTPITDIEEYFRNKVERNERVITRNLKYVGERCVNMARTNGDYMDQTGNLRSSIGYVVVKDGVILHGNDFKQTKSGADGVKQGKSFIQEIIGKSGKGIFLIVVAGMNYASYVEAGNRDVITSGELLAERLVPSMLKKLGFAVK